MAQIRRSYFLELLEELVVRFRWRLHVYVLMDNHDHLLVETPEASAGMHWLQVSYGVWFNRRHSRVGHLFQGRFKGIVLDPDTWGVALSDTETGGETWRWCLAEGDAA